MPNIESHISSLELQTQSINQNYRDNTDAIAGSVDVFVGLAGGETVKSEYEQQLESVKNRAKYLLSTLQKDITNTQKNRLQYLTNADLNSIKIIESLQNIDGKSVVQNAISGVKGEAIGAYKGTKMIIMGTIDLAKFMVKYSGSLIGIHPEYKEKIDSQASQIYAWMQKEGMTGMGAAVRDLIIKEMDRIVHLPESEQAEAIGNIGGYIISMLMAIKAGGMLGEKIVKMSQKGVQAERVVTKLSKRTNIVSTVARTQKVQKLAIRAKQIKTVATGSNIILNGIGESLIGYAFVKSLNATLLLIKDTSVASSDKLRAIGDTLREMENASKNETDPIKGQAIENTMEGLRGEQSKLSLEHAVEENTQRETNGKQTRNVTETNNSIHLNLEEEILEQRNTTKADREQLETIQGLRQYFELGNISKQRLLDEFYDDFITCNFIKEIPPENLGYIYQYFDIHSLNETDLNNLTILTKPLDIIKKSTESMRMLHIPNEWDVFQKYSWELTKISDKEINFLMSQMNRESIGQKQMEELLFPSIHHMSLLNILEALDELHIKPTIEHIYHYRSTFCIPFSEQIPLNIHQWTHQSYSSWNPDMSRKYIQGLNTDDYPFLPQDITNKMLLTGGYHDYKERIDLKFIIGSAAGGQRGESWIDNSLSLGNGRDTHLYAQKMIDKDRKILDSFQNDPVVLSKHQGPDGNAIYIITSNGNHRIAAAKIAGLPYVDVRVYHPKIPKQKEITSEKEKEELLKKISAGLINGKIEDGILVVRNLAFNEVLLPNDKLRTYISYYEKAHPNGFHNIHSQLVTASII